MKNKTSIYHGLECPGTSHPAGRPMQHVANKREYSIIAHTLITTIIHKQTVHNTMKKKM